MFIPDEPVIKQAELEWAEAKQMEKASIEHKPAPEAPEESEVPILLGDADFRRERTNTDETTHTESAGPLDLDLEVETLRASVPVDGSPSTETAKRVRDEAETSAPEYSEDPSPENPFPVGHPLHGAWLDATHKAEYELLSFKHKVEETRADVLQVIEKVTPRFQQELLEGRSEPFESFKIKSDQWWENWNILYLVGIFHIWAERALSGVWNHESAKYQEKWLQSYSKSMLETAKTAPLEGAGLERSSFLQKLQYQLSRECVYGSLQARNKVAAIQDQLPQRALQASKDDAGQGASAPAPNPYAHSGPSEISDEAQRKTERGQRLTAAQERWHPIAKRVIPFAWIHKAAGVDHKDAYGWKSGVLSNTSTMATNIERILREAKPPAAPQAE